MIIQMVTCQVGKNTTVERKTTDTFLVDRMGTDFHKSIFASGFHHPCHQAVKGDRVGCRMIGRNRFAINVIAYS